ncbi:MAG: hypothetical protein GWO02_18700 [Gammaproteobacteria bacterium]|nr:hypothetical protein [Gammaproteobacteria bacterium]
MEARARAADLGPPPDDPADEPEQVQQIRADRAAAEAAFRAAEQPLRAHIDRVWDEHLAGIREAQQARRDAIQRLALVEVEAAGAARRRDPAHPVLSEAEVGRIGQARADYDRVLAEHEAAQRRFKAGITPDEVAAAIQEVQG